MMKSIRAYSFWRFWPLSLPIQFHALLFVLIAIFHKNTPNTGCPALGVHIKTLYDVEITEKNLLNGEELLKEAKEIAAAAKEKKD